MTTYSTDIIIIGTGPIGLFTVFQAGMLKIKCHLIDALDDIGGQCIALYPEKPIYDIPAYPKILAAELIEKLKEQAEPFKPVYHLGQRAEELITNDDKTFTIITSKGTKITAKALVIASGAGAFGPNRPPLEDIEEFEGKSVFYSVASRARFVEKKVLIAGGGDSAVDWALSLAQVASKVYLLHRRNKFRCAPESEDQIKKLASEGKIELVIPYQLAGLKGQNGMLSEVIVQDFDNKTRTLEVDYLLPFYGLSFDLGPIKKWGVSSQQTGRELIDVDPTTMRSHKDRVYAIGDVAHYSNKLKLILTGFAEAATACHDIYKLIYPDQLFHFEYSTSKGIGA